MLRLGMVGVNTPHASMYTRLLSDPDSPGTPAEPNARVVALWDADPALAAAFAREQQVPAVLPHYEELIGAVDGVIVIERDQRRHAAQAEPFLRAGIPVFVNKPLADDMADARAIVACAEATGTPLFSSSALRFDPSVLALKARLAQTGPVRVAISAGYRELMYYGVHAAEMLVTVLGTGVEWAENRCEGGDRDMVHLQYADGRSALLLILRDTPRLFELRTYAAGGHEQTTVNDHRSNPMYREQLRTFIHMVQRREIPVPYSETLEIMGILCAARLSRQTGGRVCLKEL